MAHYYVIKDGKAKRYIQLTKDGRESQRINKKRMIEDGAVLGTTDALKVLGDVGGLLYWTSGLGIQAGIQAASEAIGNVTPEYMEEDDDAPGYLNQDAVITHLSDTTHITRARELHKELSEAAANRGTQMHDAIDEYLSNQTVPEDDIDARACRNVEDWLVQKDQSDFQTEHCFVWRGWINIVTGHTIEDSPDLNNDTKTKLKVKDSSWIRVDVGGTSDFVGDIIADWKSVEMKARGVRSPYLKECAQLALYRLGFKKPNAPCFNLYIDRLSGDIVNDKQWKEDELTKGLKIVAMAFQYLEIAAEVE